MKKGLIKENGIISLTRLSYAASFPFSVLFVNKIGTSDAFICFLAIYGAPYVSNKIEGLIKAWRCNGNSNDVKE